MNPAEHHAEADRLLASLDEQLRLIRETTSPATSQALSAVIQIGVDAAQAHALLATLPEQPVEATEHEERQTLRRIQALHHNAAGSCTECWDVATKTPAKWPCRTARALQGQPGWMNR